MGLSLFALAAAFTICADGPRTNCVVDGDTFWMNGVKVRLADINAPETQQAGCQAERDLGNRAKDRLVKLLNAGPFTLEIEGRDTDRYGRALRVAKRSGQSLGMQLVKEGLAETWKGQRSDWCLLLGKR